MSQTLPLPPPGFDTLSAEEQIDYVQSLWDHIAARPEANPGTSTTQPPKGVAE